MHNGTLQWINCFSPTNWIFIPFAKGGWKSCCTVVTCLRNIQINLTTAIFFLSSAWTNCIIICWLLSSNCKPKKQDLTLHEIIKMSRGFIIIVTLCLLVSKTDLINCKSCQLWQEAFSPMTRKMGGVDCLQTLWTPSINVRAWSDPDSYPQTCSKTLLAKFI